MSDLENAHYQEHHAATGRQALIRSDAGVSLVGVALAEGVHTFAIPVTGSETLEVHLTPSAITGTPTAAVAKTYVDGETTKGTAVDFDAFVADTAQSKGWTDGLGERVALLTITVGAGESITFSRAEYNTL